MEREREINADLFKCRPSFDIFLKEVYQKPPLEKANMVAHKSLLAVPRSFTSWPQKDNTSEFIPYRRCFIEINTKKSLEAEF